MSIEVAKKNNQQKKNLLSMNFGSNGYNNRGNNIILISSKPIQKVTAKVIKPEDRKDMEPEKKKDIEPRIWLYHEALTEAHKRGIKNRCHTPNEEPDGEECYYCPLACVTELIKLCKPAKKQHQRAKQYDHNVMSDKVNAKLQFVDDDKNMIKCKTCEREGMQRHIEYTNETLYSVHLASYHRIRENDVVARMLKEELYDGKQERKMHHDPKFVQMVNNEINSQPITSEKQKALT
jgi:hypothetical protein